MCKNENVSDEKFMLFLKCAEIEMIGNKMIQDVRDDNIKRGIPLVYSVDGKIYYELADGTITTNTPFDEESTDKTSDDF